jgi:hypothetical protein
MSKVLTESGKQRTGKQFSFFDKLETGSERKFDIGNEHQMNNFLKDGTPTKC